MVTSGLASVYASAYCWYSSMGSRGSRNMTTFVWASAVESSQTRARKMTERLMRVLLTVNEATLQRPPETQVGRLGVGREGVEPRRTCCRTCAVPKDRGTHAPVYVPVTEYLGFRRG